MSPFEVLYGHKCRTPVTWDSPVDWVMLGPDLLLDLEQLVTKVQGKLKEAQDRQKSSADKKRKDKDYQVGTTCLLESESKTKLVDLG